MARYAYNPDPIVSLAQSILSYADRAVLNATILGRITGAIAGLIVGIAIGQLVAPLGLIGLRVGYFFDLIQTLLFITVVVSAMLAGAVIGASIFRSAAIRRAVALRASAQMLLLMVKIEENTRPE
jgi:hypothetical protein